MLEFHFELYFYLKDELVFLRLWEKEAILFRQYGASIHFDTFTKMRAYLEQCCNATSNKSSLPTSGIAIVHLVAVNHPALKKNSRREYYIPGFSMMFPTGVGGQGIFFDLLEEYCQPSLHGYIHSSIFFDTLRGCLHNITLKQTIEEHET